MQVYTNPARSQDTYALPDAEVFELDPAWAHSLLTLGDTWLSDVYTDSAQSIDEFVASAIGWYYWYCFPGCLPDSDPVGPYDSMAAALDALRSEYEESYI